MKVLFFYIDDHTSSGYTTGLGIASISGYIKKHGFHTDLVYYKTDNDFAYAIDKVTTVSPDIVGFYSISSNSKTVQKLSQEIRKQFPVIFQIYGGIHPTLIPETLNVMQSLDAICVGYGEAPMLELVERMEQKKNIYDISGLWMRKRKNGKETIITNPIFFPEKSMHDEFLNFDYPLFFQELSRFPDFNLNTYRLEIIFNRGCPFHCTFCCNHKLNEVYHHRQFIPSPEASIAVLKKALQSTDLKFVEIHDDILTLHKKWFREFIERYASEIKVPFMCNLRAGTFDEEDVKLLKEANLHKAWIGIESGNEYIRNKVMKKGISKKQIVEAFTILHKYEIPVITQNMIGVPYETPKHFIDTIRINAELRPSGQQLYVFYPHPKTELYEISRKEGFINNLPDSDTIIERVDPVLNLPGFSNKAISFYFQNFERLVEYQRLQLQKSHLHFLPLTPQTSYIIVKIASAWDKLKRIGETIKASKVGWWLRIQHARLLKLLRIIRGRCGILYRLTPIQPIFGGIDHSKAIDRYYIDEFLRKYRIDIQGRVLEIGDPTYTQKFGGERVSHSDVLHAVSGNPHATLIGDLATSQGIPKEAFDCIILTQTLLCIYDVQTAITNAYAALKPGGVLLATFPGISQISRYDMERWGDYWRFTSLSARQIFTEVFPKENVCIETYGNVLAAVCFLHNLSAEDLRVKELNYRDQNYELVITVRAVK